MEPDATSIMMTILRLDPSASLELSTWTGRWFVQSNLHIGDGAILTGITEHRSTPEGAIEAYFDRLRSHGPDEYITNGRSGENRRNWRFAGVIFREVSTADLKASFAA